MEATQVTSPVSTLPVVRITPPSGWFARSDLQELWAYRELFYFFVWRDVKVRYKQTWIGAAWAVLQPFLTMVIFTVFFGKLAHIPSDSMPYPVFFYGALLPWLYFANALSQATNTMVENQRIITKVYFPRMILPLSSVLSGLVDFAAGLVGLVGLLAFHQIAPTWRTWFFPAFLLLAILCAAGVSLCLSALNALYRDIRYAVPFLLQFWMFASPVAYPSTLVPERWRWLYWLNPMAPVIEGFRWSMAGKGVFPLWAVGMSAITIGIVLLGAIYYFQRIETTVTDRV